MKFKKNKVLGLLGENRDTHKSYGKKPQDIQISEEQLERLLSNYTNLNETEAVFDETMIDDEPGMQDEGVEFEEDIYEFEGGEDNPLNFDSLADAVGAAKMKNETVESVMESVVDTAREIRRSIRREKITELNTRDYYFNKKRLVEQGQSEWRGGRNPGSSAASGIENIVNNIKKAYTFIKDSRTKDRIMNTLTKLDNFMVYTAELVGSGQSQRAPRTYDQVAKPLPYPDLEEPEEFEDIDDEISEIE